MLRQIVLPYGFGQTCNQLFQIAHWMPAASERGISLYFPGFRRYAHLFSGTCGQRQPRFPRTAPVMGLPQTVLSYACSWAARAPRAKIGPFFALARMLPGVVTFAWDDSGRDGSADPVNVIEDPRVAAGKTLWVRGWLYRDRSRLVAYKPCIREFFSPVPETQQRVDACIDANRKGGAILVGVHLRRGDYGKWAGGKYMYDDNVYSGLMRQVSATLPDRDVRFLLVSNEPVDRGNYAGLDIALGPGDPVGDLYSLAACDYIMGPPSTFTAWASFVGNVPCCSIDDPSTPLQLDRFAISEG
jgi:hypothetical protein